MRCALKYAEAPVRCRGKGGAGITLVELLLVLAVIGIMAGIAIPTFTRMGLLSRDDTQRTARQVMAMLKAAKIYAATYRVNTAVVYWDTRPEIGPERQEKARFFGAALVMAEVDQGGYKHYVPAGNYGSRFIEFPNNTGFERYVFENQGLKWVNIRFGDDTDVGAWAHVFDSKGRLMTPGTQELVSIKICYSPDADEGERYVEIDGEQRLRAVPIEIQRSTGRVRIATG